MEKIRIMLPCLLEQNKIATFLSLLDQRIETQNKIIEKYESLIKEINEGKAKYVVLTPELKKKMFS